MAAPTTRRITQILPPYTPPPPPPGAVPLGVNIGLLIKQI
jgi:hypothetical protein